MGRASAEPVWLHNVSPFSPPPSMTPTPEDTLAGYKHKVSPQHLQSSYVPGWKSLYIKHFLSRLLPPLF